ncbi:MAG: hypothetical protein U0946_05745 [Patescibacteria group bacterium]|nr:hypothetical protein [Patescibacteria group bacterium]
MTQTKDDLKALVTKSDFWKLEDKVDELEKKINRLPNKIEFYVSQDKLMKELVAMREENVISTDTKRQVNEHEERLEAVEDRLGIQLAVST